MAIDTFGISGSDKSYSELLVESYKKSQASRTEGLQSRKQTLQTRQKFYNELNAKLNSLISQLDIFGEYKKVGDNFTFTPTNGINDKFKTRKATATSNEFFTVKADGNAIVGSNSIKVNRIATNDVLVSNRLNLSDAFGETAGEKSFDLSVNDKTYTVTVNFTGSETNEEAMRKIVNAINGIKDVKINASLVKDTETTGRISLVSKETGENNKITFTQTSTTELLGWTTSLYSNPNARTAISGGSAGYKVSDASLLNASFEANGIEITRNSNEVKDVLPGITINLLKPQAADAQPIGITTDIDVDGFESFVDALIKEYNGVLFNLNQNKDIQRQDTAISSLQQRLRAVGTAVLNPTDDPDAPKRLTDIGFKLNNDGTLVLKDKDKLKEFLAKDNGAENIAKLFTSETGFIAKINEVIYNLKPQGGNSGLLRTRNESITREITNIDKRIASIEATIEQQAESLRKEYESYLKVYLQAQGQYSLLSTMSTSSSSTGYSSLIAQQAALGQ